MPRGNANFCYMWDTNGVFILDKSETRLDRRNYGAWYLEPIKWEPRFHELSNPKAVEMIKSKRNRRGDKTGTEHHISVR